jgi:hypothetical protein
MTARTAITTGLVNLATDASELAPSPQAADATNGNVVPFTVGSSYGPFQVVLAVGNADGSDHDVILRGSGYTGAPGDAVNSGIPAPQNTVLTQSTVGDLSVTIGHGTTRYIGPFTTDRFTQPDGTLLIDWSAGTSMTITVLQLPVTVS